MDEDIDLGLNLDDDIDEPQEEDELLKYLDDDVDDDSDEAKERAAQEEEDRLQAIVDRKIADRFVSQPEPKVEKPAPPAPRPPENTDDIIDKLADDIVSDFAVDPKKAVQKMLQTSRALANRSSEDGALRGNRNAIETYRITRKEDPVFKASREEFDKIVDGYSDEALAKASPAQVRKALEEAEDLAFGRYQRAKLTERTERKSAPAPSYSSSSRSAQPRGTETRTLSASDRTLIKMGRSAKMSEKDIKELLKENRNK